MRKTLLFLVTAIGGVLVWRRLEEQRSGREMWHEVTDPVPTRNN
ncbi:MULTISPECIES: DLW-39 family protein [unclassified Pseudactinotalea]